MGSRRAAAAVLGALLVLLALTLPTPSVHAAIQSVSPGSATIQPGQATSVTITTDGSQPAVVTAHPGIVVGQPGGGPTTYTATFTALTTANPGSYAFTISDGGDSATFTLVIAAPTTTTTTSTTTTLPPATTTTEPPTTTTTEPPTTTTTLPPESTTTSSLAPTTSMVPTTTTTTTLAPPPRPTTPITPVIGADGGGPDGGLTATVVFAGGALALLAGAALFARLKIGPGEPHPGVVTATGLAQDAQQRRLRWRGASFLADRHLLRAPIDTEQVTAVGGKITFGLLIIYLIFNRLIPDLYILPVGFALTPANAVLLLLGFTWLFWSIETGFRGPRGVVGFTSIALVLVVALAPMIHGGDMTVESMESAQRGLVFATLFTVLFLASYRIGLDVRRAMKAIYWIVALTAIEAVMGIYETLTRTYVAIDLGIWNLLPVIRDPGLASREFEGFGSFRVGGGFRATATSAHPIVLTGLLALGVLIAVTIYLRSDSVRTRWLAVFCAVPMLFAMFISNTRTGIFILTVGALVLALIESKRFTRIAGLAIVALGFLVIAILIRPQSARAMLTLITFSEANSSVTFRLTDYGVIPSVIQEGRLLIGEGFRTHNRAILQLDNSYLLVLLELGIAGVAAFVAWLFSVLGRIGAGLKRITGRGRTVAIVGFAGILALIVGSATFDSTAFDQFLPTALILSAFGLAQADLALEQAVEEVSSVAAESEPSGD